MSHKKFDVDNSRRKYLELLATHFPNIETVSTEIINLQAILNLPKGTEFFLSDLHGEHEAFNHMLRSASGVVKQKISDIFGSSLANAERKALASLIYYPEEKLGIMRASRKNTSEWYRLTLQRLVEVCRVVSSKYTRSKVRKALPKDFAYILEELLHEQSMQDKKDYYNEIIKTIIRTGRADSFIIALSKLIQKLAVDRLHILGDIFDRGPGPDIIMDTLMEYNVVDIQWGNHDILWMGAFCGSEACIANVIRISARYSNLDTVRDDYGINLLPLASFALEAYADDPCTQFFAKGSKDDKDAQLTAKMHKAISVIQFKLEAEIINRSFYEEMKDRLLLHRIDFEKKTILIDGKEYALLDCGFPTVNPVNPYELTEGEADVVQKLKNCFVKSEKLQRHMQFLFSKGGMYKAYNSNLLFHGCIPLNEDGSFKQCKIGKRMFSGKEYIDNLEDIVTNLYYKKSSKAGRQAGSDYAWYLWAGPCSPLFGKNKMATFERYFLEDRETHREEKNPYYSYRNNREICCEILREFGLDPEKSHIVNGHVPVESKNGENPVKADGKLLVIDGGMSKAYQSKTGIAGYTLISNSYGLCLVSHEPFESKAKAIAEESDIRSTLNIVEKVEVRKKVADTDIGEKLKEEIKYLEALLKAYLSGLMKEV